MAYKFPKLSQWKQIFKVLGKGEKITLLVFFVLAIGSLGFLVTDFYLSNTTPVPAFGGVFTEGVVGQPRFINPIYGQTNDIDRTLIDLTYSGLETYDKDGNITNDLAESYKISDDGKTYTFNLKNNALWSDGQPLTADDVIFTIKTIQNSDYKSPQRANWIDVEAQKISNTSLALTLKQPYNSFLENCTLKIIPKHIWQHISPENFSLSLYNLQPVTSGPFSFANLNQTKTGFIQTLNLQSNRRYHNQASHIAGISFKFFESAASLATAAKSGQIDGFTLATQSNVTAPSGFSTLSFTMPRYFAVFFNNQKTSLLSDINIRQGLAQAVNKPELVKKIGADLVAVDSPILPDFYGYQAPSNLLSFDTAKANALLDKSGFKTGVDGQRQKTTTKKPAFQFKSYLKAGSKNSEVSQLQGCLAKLSDAFKNLLANEIDGKYGALTESAVTEFQKKYLPEAKPTGETGAGTRAKLNDLCAPPASNSQPLAFTLVTVDQPQLTQAADLLKSYWAAVGITITVNAVSATDIKPIIKNRGYDMLLYGQILGMQPDLYPFWYSSQKLDPGLNLASYENKDVDKLLKDARQTQEATQKATDLQKIQTQILKDSPALFLYNPNFNYWVSKNVQGIDTTKIADPAKRFVNINNWFLQTKRIWK